MNTLLLKTVSVGALCAVSLASAGCTMNTTVGVDDHLSVGGDMTRNFDQDGDVNLMGGDMDLRGRVGGDVSVIGGDIEADLRVGGELSLVGGDIDFHGTVGEASVAGGEIEWNGDSSGEVSLAGAEISVSGRIDGPLNVAGSELEIQDTLYAMGDTALAGAEIEFSGEVRGELSAAANQMLIGGTIEGPVILRAQPSEHRRGWRASIDENGARAGGTNGLAEIAGHLSQGGAVCARRVVILRSAQIDGDLHVWSDEEVDIRSGASVGQIIREDRNGRDCEDILRDFDHI